MTPTSPHPAPDTDTDTAPDTNTGKASPIGGGIQSHGAVLVLAGPDLVVEHASLNLATVLGVDAEAALGRPLADLPLADLLPEVAISARCERRDADDAAPLWLPGDEHRTALFATLHATADGVLLELERAPSPATVAPAATLRGGPETLAVEPSILNLARATVALVSDTARYDRIFIIRLDPDGSGCVLAETRRPALPALLGQRFAATMVSPAVRRQAEAHPLRLTVDARCPPVGLLPAFNPRTGRAPDLAGAALGPFTLAELPVFPDPGVVAGLSLSLMSEGRLWGFVCGHHREPYPVAPPVRHALRAIALSASTALEERVRAERQIQEQRTAQRLTHLQHTLQPLLSRREDSMVRALLSTDPGLLDLAAADGLALIAGDAAVSVGFAPDGATLRRLGARAAAQPESPLTTTDRRSLGPDLDGDPSDSIAGLLAVAVSATPPVVIAAFRRAPPCELLRPDAVVRHSAPWEACVVAAWQTLAAGLGASTERLIEEVSTLMPSHGIDAPLLRALLDTSAATLVTVRTETHPTPTILTSNRRFRRLLADAPDPVIGQSLSAALAERGLAADPIDALAPGDTADAALAVAPDGERTLRITHRPLLCVNHSNGNGAHTQTFAAWVFEDRTATHRLESALGAARDQAASARSARSDFLATMSHALRTPLNTIIGFSEIMRAELFGALGSPKYREYVRNIQTSGESLLAVIGDSLDSSKNSTTQPLLDEQDIDLSTLAEDICRAACDHANRAGVLLRLDTAAPTLPLLADAAALTLILQTLLNNSFTFTPSGGIVTCRAGPQADGALVLSVEDSGIGMPTDPLQRTVVAPPPAHRDRHARKSAVNGPQGLALVRVLAGLLGGHVRIESRTGHGTAIHVTLPPWRTRDAAPPALPGLDRSSRPKPHNHR